MRLKTRLLIVILLGLALSFMMATSVTAQSEPANIVPYADGAVYEVSADQEVHIYWVWLALNPGLVNVYLNAAHESYVLDGPGGTLTISEVEAQQIWSPILQAPPELAGWDCPRPLVAGSLFDYNLGTLSPGQYTLTFERTLDHPVNDGLHVCTVEGQPLADTPSLFLPGTTTSSVTINVVAAE